MLEVWIPADDKELREKLILCLVETGHKVRVQQKEVGGYLDTNVKKYEFWVIFETPDLNVKEKT